MRVAHVNWKSNQGKPTAGIFNEEQENEKKRKYQQRVLDIEMGSFTPLVFGTHGGIWAANANVSETTGREAGKE